MLTVSSSSSSSNDDLAINGYMYGISGMTSLATSCMNGRRRIWVIGRVSYVGQEEGRGRGTNGWEKTVATTPVMVVVVPPEL